ncbi:hypothetical protein [Microbacterium karelineae]|uniref:hypothetical protein n=1 Tax=Microbacterium karelineae TaxID=2654283 RepID=UPI0012EA3F09|nr:hypothetical protein [Microbacterium karelineae]
MAERQIVATRLTPFQAQVCIDALDLYVEGAQGQQTQRELREARAARKKLATELAVHEVGESRG